MLRSPSIKALRQLFGADAPKAKKYLKMSRLQLLQLPAGAARLAECYYEPTTQDIRMTCLNALGGFHGVEGFTTRRGECLYLNAGDTYALTLLRYGSSYQLGCWGDIVDRDGEYDA